MNAKISNIIRTSLLVIIMLSLTFVGVVRLLQIQIVEVGKYAQQRKKTYTSQRIIPAVRGRIVDSEGRVLNSSEIVYKIILERAFLPFGEENDIIAGIVKVLLKHEHEWFDSVPILTEPNPETGNFQFQNVPSDELDKFKYNLGLNYDATVENCLKALKVNYKIDSDKYGEQMSRYIGGIRYEMEQKQFSTQNRFVLAEDISMDVMIELKEKSMTLRGVDIAEEPIRLYLDTTTLPHIRGRINAINAEQYAALKDSGYTLNDVIGFFGLEESMESVLKGENGTREIVHDSSWDVVSDKVVKSVSAGNTVKLTIDSEFQKTMDLILADFVNWINQPTSWRGSSRKFSETTAASIVVLDVPTGKILSMSNYPSYDLDDYVELMLLDAAGDSPFPYKPLLDRSLNQGYRPGSTFKTITASGALFDGVLDRNSRISCSGRYNFYSDYRPYCHNKGGHGSLNVCGALNYSCNVFFYEAGRRLKIERLAEVAQDYGVGTDLHCDVKMFPGIMTTPDTYFELTGLPWSEGNVIQAAIGQSETLMTPLHMATVAATIANGGKRYRPYLVDSVWDYDEKKLVYQTEPQIVVDMSEGNEDSYKAVQDGMLMVGQRQNTGLFKYLPTPPAYKTGTPEVGETGFNSTVIGYYPFENPQIAFSVVLEGGEYSSRVIRNIIDAYFYGHYNPVYNEDGKVMYDWTRWESPILPIR
ncbi:MAG: penicillin-binding transpeptidase domain-containing protein [Oscillospiraceae bacterium]|nr:penicillin-binding transpeptidase domain-containing protein [Oscillospiraceae bacterium]